MTRELLQLISAVLSVISATLGIIIFIMVLKLKKDISGDG